MNDDETTANNVSRPAVGAPVEASVRPDAERAAFERWVDMERPSLHASVRTYDETMAMAHVMDAAWLAWKAATARERNRCALICDTTPPYPFRASIEAAHAIRKGQP